ncbi:hypothetical protein [Botryobacter ruber]|uniref:hypothetical protein n=1 Tax=Botryobacter ruber TaxID=2171629 RepID=UPI000F647294|nr:hypothetical protein [Botryobacter ruber]
MITNEKQKDAVKSKFSVADNTCYGLLYDLSKNRIYFTIRGFWKNKEAVPNFLSDWKRILLLTMPGFTVLADFSSMLTQPQELNTLHQEARRMMLEAGVLLLAQIGPTDKIATLQADEMYYKSAIPLKKFASAQAAEEGLNNILSGNQ